MNAYLVTCGLGAREDYPELWGVLKRTPYWHCLGTSWIVKTDRTVQELFSDLVPHIDESDKLLVVRLHHEAQWTASFPVECREWLSKNL